ncbi:hypothetical protein PHYBOEH_010383 [Phytophthora boehmeriae]|uniref:PH domain-containing protein n=1 Tax=Phytophthora boehmeriae TaxID=109152 RepID=A0A8T1VN28_9STRA|nr:hypothetical protein PHYBOEH_010383 [Phytophthora boehmeriae]
MLIPATVMAEACSVRLKRKVRNAETKLFEWRPCSCKVVASEGRLLLHLQTPPDDDDQLEEEDAAAETITIDLATQLLNVIPKKNKTRCDLVFYASATAMTGDVVKEEFMAPSAAHCQQWMAQVQRAQKQAQEQQQRRPDSTSPARPTMAIASVAPLPSPIDVDLNSSSRNSKTSNVSNGAAVELSPLYELSSLKMLKPKHENVNSIKRYSLCAMQHE